jgi:hypothetical protein
MDTRTAQLLLIGLLQRLDADAKAPQPLFGALVGDVEREALAVLVRSVHGSEEVGSQLIAPGSQATMTSTKGSTNEPETILNLACIGLDLKATHVACVDFGTAKSKAFASRILESDDDELDPADLVELGVGTIDGDADPYATTSSVWISNEGRMFAGNRALDLSRSYIDGIERERFDSIKRQLINAYDDVDSGRPLRPTINPTATPLTYEEAICFFLAFLMDLVGRSLIEKQLSRYTPKRFTVPAWNPKKRRWAVRTLGSYIKLAHILADTFSGQWDAGIPIKAFKSALQQARTHEAKLGHLLDRRLDGLTLGISEPVAAGTGRLLTDKGLRNLVLVIDVGAGTTDLALFRVTPWKGGTKFFPIVESQAKNMAGDWIDECLAEFALDKAGHTDQHDRAQLKSQMFRRGLRLDKERLLIDGSRDVEVAPGRRVAMNREAFLEYGPVKAFSLQLEDYIGKFLAEVGGSYFKVASSPTVLFTGGGASLPFVQSLRNRRWTIAGVESRLSRPKRTVPEQFEQFGDLVYQQLAVAIGGSLKAIDEGARETEYRGGVEPLGPLTRYSVTGS